MFHFVSGNKWVQGWLGCLETPPPPPPPPPLSPHRLLLCSSEGYLDSWPTLRHSEVALFLCQHFLVGNTGKEGEEEMKGERGWEGGEEREGGRGEERGGEEREGREKNEGEGEQGRRLGDV